VQRVGRATGIAVTGTGKPVGNVTRTHSGAPNRSGCRDMEVADEDVAFGDGGVPGRCQRAGGRYRGERRGGSLDPTFGTGGTLTTNLPGGGQASVALIQPDGKILVIGQGFIPGGGVTLILTRYLAQ
jgi:hypothetical protein